MNSTKQVLSAASSPNATDSVYCIITLTDVVHV